MVVTVNLKRTQSREGRVYLRLQRVKLGLRQVVSLRLERIDLRLQSIQRSLWELVRLSFERIQARLECHDLGVDLRARILRACTRRDEREDDRYQTFHTDHNSSTLSTP